MHKLYDLKEMLCEELEKYAGKDKLDAGGLSVIDTLAHAIKNIDKIIEASEEEGYSGRYDGGSYRDGGSYARGRGGNVRRDSMGRYSRRYYNGDGYSRAAEDMAEQLRNLMQDAPDEQTRKDIQRLVTKIEGM